MVEQTDVWRAVSMVALLVELLAENSAESMVGSLAAWMAVPTADYLAA